MRQRVDRVLARKFEREIKTDMNLDAHGIYATHTHTKSYGSRKIKI